MESTTNLTSSVDIDIKSNQENDNLRSSMNCNNVVPGTTHGSHADNAQRCIGVGPDGQSNLKLEGVESGEIESSSFKLPSATQPILSKKRSPIGRKQKSSEFYREGLNPTLDEKLVAYKKKRPFAGDAILNVLTETEIEKMGKLWWKQKSTPFRMTVLEVTTLLEMVTRITAWRKSMTSEKARTRMENFRRRV